MEYQHGGDIYTQEIETDYSANINPLGLPEGVRDMLAASIGTEVCSVYPDSRCTRLREALGRHHGVPEEWIICGNGAADLIFGLVYAEKPERALVTAPAFSEYEQALNVCGCRTGHLVLQEKDGFAVDMDRLLHILTDAYREGKPYDMVFLCNPNNPTGIPITAQDMQRAAKACLETGTLLVADECFCDFMEKPEECSVVPLLGENGNLFVLKAFTKLYSMAGLRLGYGLCSNGELLERLNRVRQPWSVSGLAQKAGEAALEETEYVKQTRALIETEREWLRRELEALGFTVYDSRANYLFFRVFDGEGRQKPDRDGSAQHSDAATGQKGWLYHRLLARRVLIRSCGNYPGLDASYYRICVKTRAENQQLMEHMKAAVREQQEAIEETDGWQRQL